MAYGRYYAKKVRVQDPELGEVTLDSEMEARYFALLAERRGRGEIAGLRVHPRYVLQGAFDDAAGRHFAELAYEADFEYLDLTMGAGPVRRVADVKGFEAPEFPIHRKLFEKAFCCAGPGGEPPEFPLGLEVLKWSKSTGWADADEYKKLRRGAVARAKAEKREAQKALEAKEREDAKRRKEVARIRELRARRDANGGKLAKADRERLAELEARWADWIA